MSGTVTHQQGKKNTMVFTVSYDNENQRNQSVGGVTLPAAGVNWSSIEQDTVYNQLTVIRPTLLNQVRMLVGNKHESWERVTSAPRIVVLDAFTGGGAQNDHSRTEHHFTLTDIVSWSTGRHALKFGFEIPDWSRRRFDDNTNTLGTFYFSNLADYTASRPYSFIQHRETGTSCFWKRSSVLLRRTRFGSGRTPHCRRERRTSTEKGNERERYVYGDARSASVPVARRERTGAAAVPRASGRGVWRGARRDPFSTRSAKP